MFYIMIFQLSSELLNYDVLWFTFTCGDHVVLTPFCGDYLCVHYFYVPWLIMTSQWVIILLRMPHCGIILGNDVTMDIHCDVTMGNDVTMYTYHGTTMHNNVAMNLFCYILLSQIMILLFPQHSYTKTIYTLSCSCNNFNTNQSISFPLFTKPLISSCYIIYHNCPANEVIQWHSH